MYNGPQRKPLRLKNYNYASNGFYFVTLCTKGRENFFGEIIDGKMTLNDYGNIACKNWENIIEHYQNIQIDEFIIMPNHIHGVIIIEGNEYLHSNKGPKTNVSNVIKGFKIGCTKEIRNVYEDYNFGWQKSFFDKIIRNDEQLNKTRTYIINNPLKWELDVNNPKNIKEADKNM